MMDLARGLETLGVDVTDVDAMARYLRTAAERLAARLEQVGPDQYHAAARRVGRQQTGQSSTYC